MSYSTLLLLLTLAPSVFGQSICEKFSQSIDSQADIAAVSQCVILGGSLGIDRDFRGDAVIPGITSLESFWAGNPGASHSTPTLGPTYVQSISLPDLVYAGTSYGGLQISGAEYLTDLSVPKLKKVAGVLMVSGTAIKSLSFPSLEEIGSRTYFSGNIDEISLPKLTKLMSMSIDSTGGLDCGALWDQLKTITFTDPDTEYFPAFKCKSPKGEVNSPLTPGETTTPATPTTTPPSSSSSTSPTVDTPTTTPSTSGASTTSSSSGVVSSTVQSTTSAGTTLSSTATITSSSSTTLAPVAGNSTVTLRTSTRISTASTRPTALGTSAGNAVVTGAWSTIGSVVVVAMGVLFM